MALPGRFHQDQAEGGLGSVLLSLGSEVSVITLAGEVDLTLQDELDVACRQVLRRDRPVRIDARRLSFIDSSGLSLLARVAQARVGGRPPQLVGASPLIHDTIALSGLVGCVELR